jgi:hypothetical protein
MVRRSGATGATYARRRSFPERLEASRVAILLSAHLQRAFDLVRKSAYREIETAEV